MSHPLIIIGAGASYDCTFRNEYPRTDFDLDKWAPPLTNSLFDGTRFHELLEKYREMDSIVSYIRSRLRGGSLTFEDILTSLNATGTQRDPSLKKGIVALLFYLSDLFITISDKYYRSSNNFSVLRHIINQNGGRATIVNFNYDLLLEKTFGRGDVDTVDEFLSEETPIIKIHGACNWYWERKVNLFENKSSYKLYIEHPEATTDTSRSPNDRIVIVKNSDPMTIMANQYGRMEGYSHYPAIALPIKEKGNYVCPDTHMSLLENHLSNIDRILIIGWKMGDTFLLGLLEAELKKRPITIAYIGGNDSDATISTSEIIKKNIKMLDSNGFTHSTESGELEDFLTSID